MPLPSIRLLAVPSSLTDRRASAVLAIPADATLVRAGPRALPYQCISGRLYIPAEAELHPPVSDRELREVCPWALALIHPSIGLVGFAEAEVLRVTDLLTAQPPHASTWAGAQPGIYSEPHVREVRPLVIPSLEEVLKTSRDDIGDAPLDELPPAPDEGLLKQLGRQVRLGGIQGLRKLLPAAKGPSASQGAMAKLSNWAARRSEDLRAQINAARQRELSRLVRLLEKDPDEGLRYALPLSGSPASRGEVEGGWRLTRRETSFNLGNVFGSRPTSFWDTPWDAQQRLQARYRELATRELALGRHRRAAYIFSELLGDHHSAAGALAEGRFFREAATLYREKLKNPAAAAACLEGGGLLHEAAEAYESLSQYEKAGDLHASLGSHPEATRLYEAAVTASTARGDTLGAARVIERKLNEPDVALKRLSEAWDQGSNQADQCLRESFRLLARLGRHTVSETRLNELRAAALQTSRPAALAKVLADVAGDYPTSDARALARDAARVVAGYGLASDVHTLEHPSLLQVVARTNVEDRLLHRDTVRYRELTNPRVPSRSVVAVPPAFQASPSRYRKRLEVIRRIALPGSGVSWRSAAALEGGFLALGVSDLEVVVARGDWNGKVQTTRCAFANAASLHFRMAGVGDTVIITPLATPRRLPMLRLPPFQNFNELTIGHRSVLPDGEVYGIAADDSGEFNVLRVSNNAELVMDRISAAGRLTSTVQVLIAPSELIELESLWMHVHEDHSIITAGSRLHWLTRGVLQPPFDLPSAAHGLVGSPRHTSLRVGISMEDGGCALVWPQQHEVRVFGKSIDGSMPALLPDGLVVAIGSATGAIFETNNRTLSLAGETVLNTPAPVKVIVSDAADRHVAGLYPDGAVVVFAVK